LRERTMVDALGEGVAHYNRLESEGFTSRIIFFR